MVAAVLGVIAGAVLPGGIQLAERAAVSGDQSDLRAVATTYLTAISDGRASDATAMVPVQSADEVPDAVLQSATRITDPAVRLVHIDGDAATVEVEYTLGRPQISRTLDAERVGGTWQITTPLLEAVPFGQYSSARGATIAGFDVSRDEQLRLYPGIYSFDSVVDDPIIATRSDPFSVDGDPATPTQPYIELTLTREAAEDAEAVVLAIGEHCREVGSCDLPADATLKAEEWTWVMSASAQVVDLAGQLNVTTDYGMATRQVIVQIERDAAGGAGAWLCSALDATATIDMQPCPAID